MEALLKVYFQDASKENQPLFATKQSLGIVIYEKRFVRFDRFSDQGTECGVAIVFVLIILKDVPAVKALGAPTYYILSRRENYVWGLSIHLRRKLKCKN